MADYKQQAMALLKSMETGDDGPVSYINPNNFVQHNLTLADGLQGLLERRKLNKGSFRVNTVRAFQDGNFVFMHNEFNIPNIPPLIGFDIYRFENEKIVEHWDNFQVKSDKPSPSGHTMTDGPAIASELEQTAANKKLMQDYMDDLINGRRDKFQSYFDGNSYIQHNSLVADNLTGLIAGLQDLAKQGKAVQYTKVHMVLGEGNFVLVVAEGMFGDKSTSYYDLYRIQNGKIAEHWDTIQTIPPESEWKNPNGKF